MRDHKKFCLPKLVKYPTQGDIMIRLKNGETGVVTPEEYEKIKSFFQKIGEYEVQEIEEPENQSTQIDYVEIGGVKWATMNIGATSITDTGLYFQWGDTQGYTAEQVGSGEGQKYLGWADYKYGNGTSYPDSTDMVKYNATDGKTVLDPTDDAVIAAWGDNWRMPTTEEFQALETATTNAWTDDYEGSGIAGLVLTDKTDSSKVLFFPAAGLFDSGSVKYVGSEGNYWSDSVKSTNATYAYSLNFSSSSVNWQYGKPRCQGCPVRPVLDE